MMRRTAKRRLASAVARAAWLTLGITVLLGFLAIDAFVICPSGRTAPPHLLRAVLEFREPTTGVNVKLVGAMHYNPTSIQLAESTIKELGEQNNLAAVVIESCFTRWNNTASTSPLLQSLLKSEMSTACDSAASYSRPVVLGDQPIEITVQELRGGLTDTARNLLAPTQGGWSNLTSILRHAYESACPSGEGYLGPLALVSPQLLLGAPISFLKYPASYLLKSPLFFLTVVGVLSLTDLAADATAIPTEELSISDWVGSLAFSGLETLFFARVFFSELLADRNVVLAENILEQCRLCQKNTGSNNKQDGWNFLPTSWQFGGSKNTIPYVPGTEPSRRDKSTKNDDPTVVAVLGMAHCNGIKKLLKEQLVS